MVIQVMGQFFGGGGLFISSGNIGMVLFNDMYDLYDFFKVELVVFQFIMLVNVVLIGEVNGSCCDYLVGEERQMVELMFVGDNNFLDSEEGEGFEEFVEIKGEFYGLENMELRSLEFSVVEFQFVFEVLGVLEVYSLNKDFFFEIFGVEDKGKSLKIKFFCCKLCQYEVEFEEQFVYYIRVYSVKKFFVEESVEKQVKVREFGFFIVEEGDFFKGFICCDCCGYNIN